MNSIRDTSAWHGTNRYGAPFERLDCKRQLEVLLDVLGDANLHRKKFNSFLTKKKRAYVVFQFVADIRKVGFKIHNLTNLDQRHIAAALGAWQQKGLSASTMQTRLSVLRWLATALGKRGLVMPPTFYGVQPEVLARSYVATEDKSWTAQGRIPGELIEAARALDQWAGAQLEIMQAFGLRLSEALLLRPRASDTGTKLVVEEGTKGGRARVVPIATPLQREVLDRAKELAAGTSRGSMVPPGKSPAQARNRLYYVCRKLGITKQDLAITPHGLRHQYANDLYEEIAGVPSMVRGGSKILDRAADLNARHTVTQALGHTRVQITAAYTGPRPRGRPPTAQPAGPQPPQESE